MLSDNEIVVGDFFDRNDAKEVYVRELQVDSLIPPFGVNAAYIAHVSVTPRHQRFGIGSRLLSHVIDQVKSQNIPRLVLDVFAENSPAIGLYENFGFITTALNACSDPSSKIPEMKRMILDIDPSQST